MRIKNFKESISGWELVGKDMGPNYPEQKLQNTISDDDTSVILGMDGKIYSEDEFLDLYNIYQKTGGKKELSSFNKKNLDEIIHLLIL